MNRRDTERCQIFMSLCHWPAQEGKHHVMADFGRIIAAPVALGLVLVACTYTTDLNKPCVMQVQRVDAGTQTTSLKERELINVEGLRSDFISRTVNCDYAYCVRDQYYVSDAGPDDPAQGYCSSPCDPSISATCASYSPDLDRDPTQLLHCRSLLLSKESLNAISTSDGGSVGGIRTPTFCARGTGNAGS